MDLMQMAMGRLTKIQADHVEEIARRVFGTEAGEAVLKIAEDKIGAIVDAKLAAHEDLFHGTAVIDAKASAPETGSAG